MNNLATLLERARLDVRADRLMLADEMEEQGRPDYAASLRLCDDAAQIARLAREMKADLTGQPCLAVPMVGCYVEPDGWDTGSRLVLSDWDDAPFRLPSVNHLTIAYPVRIKVTSRVERRGPGGTSRVRVQIEWVHDGEAPSFSGGWMSVANGW